MNNLFNNFKRVKTSLNIGTFIENQARKNNEIIYGARSLKKQIGLFSLARPTSDYDVYSSKPKRSAVKIEKTLDQSSGGNNYYVKPALHPGTYKVIDVGFDQKKNTRDDFGVVDYTKPDRRIKFKKINGIKYAAISEIVKDRKKSLADKESAFRHPKDRRDLSLIDAARRFYRRK